MTATIPSQLRISDADAARFPLAVAAIAAALDDLGSQRVHVGVALEFPADRPDFVHLVVELGPGRPIRFIHTEPRDDAKLAAAVRKAMPFWAKFIAKQKAIPS